MCFNDQAETDPLGNIFGVIENPHSNFRALNPPEGI